MCRAFVLSVTQMLGLLSFYMMLSIFLSILGCRKFVLSLFGECSGVGISKLDGK